MYSVYVLRTVQSGQLYTGFCSELVQRLGHHNSGITKSTRNRGPWELVHHEEFPTRAEALRRERFLKTGKGRGELKRLMARPLR